MIYPIDQMIEDLLESSVNEETGELKYTEEELQKKLDDLQMSFDEKIDNLCSLAKNAKAAASDIKDEKMRLAKRQSSEEKASERAKKWVAYLLQGKKFKNAKHNLYYLESSQIVVDDREALLKWCKINASEFLNEPTLREDDIKKAIMNGREIPFAHIQKNRSVVIR